MKLIVSSLLLAGLFITTAATAQWKKVVGNGNMVTRERAVGNFTSVTLSGGMQVLIVPANAASVTVEADENLQEYIITEVNGDKLSIHVKNDNSISSKNLVIRVGMPRLDGAHISGSGNIKSAQSIPSNGTFDATISGSGSIFANTSASKVKARISGSGNIQAGGSTSELDVVISGSGSFKGFDLAAKEVDVTISGSGNVETTVNGKLDAHISGSGSVIYKGDADISLKASGSGKIKRAE